MKWLIALITALTVNTVAHADTQPFNLSLAPDVAIFDRDTRIEGLTLSLWGQNPQTALSLGVINGSTGQSGGFSWALVLNYTDSYTGIQWAPINYSSGEFLGWQHGFINIAEGSMTGLQSGWINYANRLNGLQFGVINVAMTVDAGLQIGLINVIQQNDHWFTDLPNELAPAMIFVNWRF